MTRHLFLQGDARVGLQIVPPGSVHCCVTIAGSMTVTDPKRLKPYYKSGVPDGD